jgi:HEAT repeat protein
MDVIPRGAPDAPDPFDPGRGSSFPGWVEPLQDKPAAPAAGDEREPPAPGDSGTWPSLEADRSAAGRSELAPAVKAAGVWLHMFARTLKTCRLYDAGNPTVLRFREELVLALHTLLAAHGAVSFRFTAEDVTCEGQSLYSARSRDDNLAFAFYRDGVRGLTIQPGADERECNALVDSVLSVTGQNLDGDDLVTLLWEANLRHVDVDYIPAEGETGAGEGAGSGAGEEGALLPWPTAGEGAPAGAEGTRAANDATPGAERSEDWALGELTEEVEATFAELDFMSEQEVKRFTSEYAAERRVPQPMAAAAIANACLLGELTDDDRRELARFLPRVLRAAITAGAWGDAREALRLVRESNTGEWSDETFTQEVLQPVSITRTVEKLDTQGPAAVAEFLALANELGEASLDWLTLTLSESQARMTRQLVAEAITLQAQRNPARLAPWLNDPRWYVVRNVVHILGWVGGAGIVPLLASAVRYPDPRVTAEVVRALQGIELRLARPVLIKALEGADTKLFCLILHQLSAARDPAVARYVTAFLAQERFLQRPVEERRAVYAAVASTGGDEVVPDLEKEINGGNWFDREQEVHRHAVARCLARIGTPRAQAALEAGAQSRRAPVRQACTAALQSRMAA